MYQVDLARYYKQKEAYEAGEPVPEINADEATRLYNEHLKSGMPFKGRKGRKLQDIPPPTGGLRIDSDVSSDDSEAEAAPPPKAKRQKKDDGKPAKSTPAAKAKGAPAPVAPALTKVVEVSP